MPKKKEKKEEGKVKNTITATSILYYNSLPEKSFSGARQTPITGDGDGGASAARRGAGPGGTSKFEPYAYIQYGLVNHRIPGGGRKRTSPYWLSRPMLCVSRSTRPHPNPHPHSHPTQRPK